MNPPKESYPLTWPDNWPRTAAANVTHSKFGTWQKPLTINRAITELLAELRRLGVKTVTFSSNLPTRKDGMPYSDAAQPRDAGFAAYFEFKSKPRVLACDKWRKVQDNIYAIAKHIEAMRGQQRWGVGNIEQAFRGYTALPENAGDWWKTLELSINATREQIDAAYHRLVKIHHPDHGGSHEKMVAINRAYEEATKENG